MRHAIKGAHGLIVPAGARHNLVTTGDKALQLCTIDAPPHHVDKLAEKTRAEAEAFDSVTSEQSSPSLIQGCP